MAWNAAIFNEEQQHHLHDTGVWRKNHVLSILELIFLSGVLTEFDCYTTVPSDIGVDQLYLPPESYNTQRSLDKISAWTDKNLMMINADKTNYMVFSRSQSDFVTRLHLNNSKIEQVPTAKIVGV